MGDVVRFPRRHARASAGSAAASSASSSAVTPAFCAVGVRKIEDQYSAGMRRFGSDFHLRTAQAPAPTSAASASGESQSSTTSRKLEIMELHLGHSVLKCKADLSRDLENHQGQNVLMGKRRQLTDFERDFIARARSARRARFASQEDLCEVLELEQDAYKWYEVERLLPHELIPRFIKACGVSFEWLMAGKGPGPAVEPLPPRRVRRTRRKKIAA